MFQDIQVLHVDDDAAIRDLTAEFLERVDDSISVRSESDPTNASARIENEPIDCVVCDYDMPERNGLELCWSLRTEHPWLPFILFTNERGNEIVEKAMNTGATDYIQKDTGTGHYTLLANRITIAVTRHRAIRRLRDADALPAEWPPYAAPSDRSDAPSKPDIETRS